MKANENFINLPRELWAYVKYLSQKVGYTKRNSLMVKAPSMLEIKRILKKNDFDQTCLLNNEEVISEFGKNLLHYFDFRAGLLNTYVEPRLMSLERARETYNLLIKKLKPKCPIPMNKQKGEKKYPAYFTGIINMLFEANAGNHTCDFEPKELTLFTRNGKLVRTLSRRVDGAFPSIRNPSAIWEIKEYYYTTTFGSRVADGIFETLLDGLELLELRENEKLRCRHYLMVDGYFTWWNLGRSYLCRIIDMLHMGYVDEVLFGYEVVELLPDIIHELINHNKPC